MEHIAPISGVACHGESLVATAGYDNKLILWDATKHRAIACASHDHLANMCTFNRTGTLLASASSDYSARIWQVPSMRLQAVLTGHSDDIEMVAFAPDGARVATCSRDHTIRVYDVSGAHLATCIGHSADVISVAWTQSGTELVSSSDDGTVRSWRAADGTQLSVNSFDGVETDTIAIGHDGIVFAGDDEGRISVLRGPAVELEVKAHEAGIKRLVFSEGSEQLVSLSYDRRMRLWSFTKGELIECGQTQLPNTVWPRSCAFLGRNRLAFATFGSTYAVYDVDKSLWEETDYRPSRSINAVLPVKHRLFTVGDAGIVRCDNQYISNMGGLCNFLCSSGTMLITGGQMGSVHDATTGATLYQHRSPLNCACSFDREGEPHFAVGTYTGEVVVLKEAAGGLELVSSIPMHDNAIKGLATDGVLIFGVSANRNTAVVSVATLTVSETWRGLHNQIANGCACVAPRVFCSVSRDLTLRIWSRDGVEEIRTPHQNSVKCVASDGRLIVTGDYAGRVAVYDFISKAWLEVVRPSTSGISSLAANPAEGVFVASCYDGRIYGIKVDNGDVHCSVVLDVPLQAQLIAAE